MGSVAFDVLLPTVSESLFLGRERWLHRRRGDGVSRKAGRLDYTHESGGCVV
jgi:hypothetical protein